MSLQDERCAFHGGGVRAFAAFGDALFDQALRVGQQRNALAGVAFAAGIVFQTFTVGGLREEASEGVFTGAAWTGE
jgi:hypothetical protein